MAATERHSCHSQNFTMPWSTPPLKPSPYLRVPRVFDWRKAPTTPRHNTDAGGIPETVCLDRRRYQTQNRPQPTRSRNKRNHGFGFFTRKHQSPEDIPKSWHAFMIFYLSSICLISVTVVTLQNHPTPGYAVITREKANYISYNKPAPSISRRFAAGYPLRSRPRPPYVYAILQRCNTRLLFFVYSHPVRTVTPRGPPGAWIINKCVEMRGRMKDQEAAGLSKASQASLARVSMACLSHPFRKSP